jgi:exonuclease VII large subunit
VLERGYAIITRQRGKGEEIITHPGQAPRGRKLRIEFAEGSIGAISEGPEDAGLQLDLLGGDPPAN